MTLAQTAAWGDSPVIRARDVCKVFEGGKGEAIPAVLNLNLDVAQQEFVAIVGPSGCGKSTFLMMIAGLVEASSGDLLVENEQVSGPDTRCGVVFQEYLLFPWKTVRGNVEFGPSLRGMKKDALEALSSRFIRLVGLEGFENHYPHELSGGMKQRVAIARVLANDPRVLLMDEPFGSLDALTREGLQGELLRIWSETTCTVVFVTHSIVEAVYLADRVVVMSKRPGRIKETLHIDLPRPRTREITATAAFREYEMELRRIVWTEV